MINKNIFLIASIVLILGMTSACTNKGVQNAPGDIIVQITAGQDVGWSQTYYELDFGSINICDSADSEGFAHGMEIINNGLTPVNVEIRYDTALFSDPASEWNYKADCVAINPTSGNVYTFAGNCWDGVTGMQDTYTDILNTDTNVIRCLNYRDPEATTKPGIRIDNELIVSCTEPLGPKNGVVAMTFSTADIATDCGGDSGYDPGGL
jgi:hypothetical protein